MKHYTLEDWVEKVITVCDMCGDPNDVKNYSFKRGNVIVGTFDPIDGDIEREATQWAYIDLCHICLSDVLTEWYNELSTPEKKHIDSICQLRTV